MASSDSKHVSINETASKVVEDHLKSRQNADSRPRLVQESQEKAKLQPQLSADANSLSREKKQEKLENFMKQRHGRRHHRRRRRRLTLNEVKAETAKILEEFLLAQLNQQDIPTKSPEKRYERYVEANITEETTPSSSSNGYLASVTGMLREDSIPYADDSECELTKAESLPHDDFMEKYFNKSGDKKLEIIHSKSRSAPYNGNEVEICMGKPRAFGHRPPPPAPPGTPHTPSEQGSSEVIDNVPYRGKSTDSSIPYSTDSVNADNLDRRHSIPKRPSPPKAPSTLDLPKPIHRSGAPSQSDACFYSGPQASLSSSSQEKSSSLPVKRRQDKHYHSSDTSDEGSDNYNREHLRGRKKKSMFKKAQERLSSLLRLKGDHSPHDHSEYSESKPKEKKRKGKKSKKRRTDDQEDGLFLDKNGHKVLGERHVHTTKHIHQTHIGEKDESVYRTEDGTRVVDEDSPEGRKHIKIDWNVKESADSDVGIMGRLKRLTSRSDKKRMKGSKSMTIGGRKDDKHSVDKHSSYSRAVSVPGQQVGGGEGDIDRHTQIVNVDDSDGFSVTEVDNVTDKQTENIHVSQVVSRKSDDIKRHSSHLDIVDHMGDMVERIYFDPDEDKLPRNKSFDFVSESDILERRILTNGRVKVVQEVDTHERMSFTEDDDVEEDGRSDGPQSHADMSEVDKDELYTKIAERLAMIGDNLTVEREMEIAKSAASSPNSKLSSASGGTDPKFEPEIKKTGLTELEAEIRDELRMVADQIDARMVDSSPGIAADAKQAAVRIAGMVTYSHFKNVVQETVGNEPGWAQVAAVFTITKKAIQVAGASGALAMQIKEMSLRYIEDRFANWIVGQGGWDSMLSDNSDSDRDYSDVD